jgi:hypothetical protein
MTRANGANERLVVAWPELPEATRAAKVATVKAALNQSHQT